MNTQDAMARALAETKCLDALVYLLTHGREVEFWTDGERCFISQSTLWIGQAERQFASAQELAGDQAFLALWADARVETIF